MEAAAVVFLTGGDADAVVGDRQEQAFLFAGEADGYEGGFGMLDGIVY